MRIGIGFPSLSPFATRSFIDRLGRAIDDAGFHSLWVPEHVVSFDDYQSQYPYTADGRYPTPTEVGLLEPFSVLSFLAAVTERVRLGTGMCLVPQRNPVYTAKEVATLDWLTAGRVDVGVGIGWLAEEFAALGTPFVGRGQRCRDYLEVMRRLWCDDAASYHSDSYDLPACHLRPRPIQQPHPPIYFGGESDAALRRVADLGQGWYGLDVLPEDLPIYLERLRVFLGEQDRVLEDLEIVVSPYLRPATFDLIAAYAEAGADQVVLFPLAADLDQLLQLVDDITTTIIEPAAAL